jgi:hypothetical protein
VKPWPIEFNVIPVLKMVFKNMFLHSQVLDCQRVAYILYHPYFRNVYISIPKSLAERTYFPLGESPFCWGKNNYPSTITSPYIQQLPLKQIQYHII